MPGMRQMHQRPGRPPGATRWVLIVLIFVVFCSWVAIPQFGEDFQTIPGDLGDSRFVNYILEHGFRFLIGQSESFWNARFFYPHENVIALSENQLGAVPFYALFRLAGLDRETSFQFWILTGFLLNYFAMAFVLDRFRLHWFAVALGAAVFAFSPAHILHLGHPQLAYKFAAPLAWYYFHQFLNSYATRNLLAASVFACWQWYISFYPGYFLSLLLAGYCMVRLWQGRFSIREYWAGCKKGQIAAQAGIAACGASALLWLFCRYIGGAVPGNELSEVLDLLPRPISYVFGSPGEFLARFLFGTAEVVARYPAEHALFVGYVPMAGVVVGATVGWRREHGMRTALAALLCCGAGMVLVTLSVGGVSVYSFLVRFVPGLSGLRAVTRVIHILLLPIAAATAVSVHLVLVRWRGRWAGVVRTALVVVILGLGLWDFNRRCAGTPKTELKRRVQDIVGVVGRGRIGGDSEAVLAALPADAAAPFYASELDAMLAAQSMGIPTLNGYSRVTPAGFAFPRQCSDIQAMLRRYEAQFGAAKVNEIWDRLRVYPGNLDCGVFRGATSSKGVAHLPDGAYQARVTPQCLTCSTRAGGSVLIVVDVENSSPIEWPQEGIGLSARFIRVDNHKPLSGFDLRVYLEVDFRPGDRRPYLLLLRAPEEPAQYLVEIDLVHEGITWFSDRGMPRIRVPVEVRP